MALENLISISFTDEELQQIDSHLTALESLLKGKCINLTPDQRKEYGRLGNRTENWVKKVVDYTTEQPSLSPVYLDKAELDKDYIARQALMPRFNKLSALNDMVDDTLSLIGSDLYINSLAYYKNLKLLAEKNVSGAKTVYDDLSTQFPGRPVKKSETVKTA
jgi:hypothetical protein